jgi:hypothetical protein
MLRSEKVVEISAEQRRTLSLDVTMEQTLLKASTPL